jgi:hypothetical protein
MVSKKKILARSSAVKVMTARGRLQNGKNCIHGQPLDGLSTGSGTGVPGQGKYHEAKEHFNTAIFKTGLLILVYLRRPGGRRMAHGALRTGDTFLVS